MNTFKIHTLNIKSFVHSLASTTALAKLFWWTLKQGSIGETLSQPPTVIFLIDSRVFLLIFCLPFR